LLITHFKGRHLTPTEVSNGIPSLVHPYFKLNRIINLSAIGIGLPYIKLRRMIFHAELLICGRLNLSLHVYLLNLLLFLARRLRLIDVDAAHWLIVIELIHRGCIHDCHLGGMHVGPLDKGVRLRVVCLLLRRYSSSTTMMILTEVVIGCVEAALGRLELCGRPIHGGLLKVLHSVL
jgi:hypothetical protein